MLTMTDPRAGESQNTGTDARSVTEKTQQRPQGATSSQARPATHRQQPSGQAITSLVTDSGSTRISDGVVAKIAGLAARDIPGVYSMGTGMARRVGHIRAMIPGSGESASAMQGVSVEVGEREAAIDLDIVTWYGQSIVDVSEAVRRNVAGQVEGMTGLKVVEVNINVDDIHVETEQNSQPEQRVQ